MTFKEKVIEFWEEGNKVAVVIVLLITFAMILIDVLTTLSIILVYALFIGLTVFNYNILEYLPSYAYFFLTTGWVWCMVDGAKARYARLCSWYKIISGKD